MNMTIPRDQGFHVTILCKAEDVRVEPLTAAQCDELGLVRSATIPRNQGFRSTIMCPRCKTEDVHYLMALCTGGVWTGAPSVRIGKHHAQRIAVEEFGLEAGERPFGNHANGLMQPSEITGRDQWVQMKCGRCKGKHQVKLETLKLAAHMAWKNQWPRLTFDDGDALVKFDDQWLR